MTSYSLSSAPRRRDLALAAALCALVALAGQPVVAQEASSAPPVSAGDGTLYLGGFPSRIFVIDVDSYLKVSSNPDTPKYGDPDRPPPSTMVGVTRLSDPDFLIEIDLTAIVEA